MEETPPAGFRFSARSGLYRLPPKMPVIPANPLDRLNDKPLYNMFCLAEAPSFVVQKVSDTTGKATRVFKLTKTRVVQSKPVSPHRDPHPARAASGKDKLQKLLSSLKQHVLQQTDPKLRMLCASLIAQCVKAIHQYS